MVIQPNRHYLKELSGVIVDFQFAQQQATQVFSFNGESTPDFVEVAKELNTLFGDILSQVQNLKSKIPAIS
jgi:hypothetical protein